MLHLLIEHPGRCPIIPNHVDAPLCQLLIVEVYGEEGAGHEAGNQRGHLTTVGKLYLYI